MTTPLDKVLYTAEAHTTGGRDGAGKSSDGAIDVKLSSPGSGKPGTNPEQLFAVGYAACFIGAMKAVGPKISVKVPDDVSVMGYDDQEISRHTHPPLTTMVLPNYEMGRAAVEALLVAAATPIWMLLLGRRAQPIEETLEILRDGAVQRRFFRISIGNGQRHPVKPGEHAKPEPPVIFAAAIFRRAIFARG